MKRKNIEYNKKNSAVSVGIVSLITFFTILLLTSFSILILSSARTDQRLTQMTADAIVKQYEGDAQAEQLLFELYEICEITPYEDLEDALFNTSYIVVEDDSFDGKIVEYKSFVDENKYYYVKIGVPEDMSEGLSRLSWQLVADIAQ